MSSENTASTSTAGRNQREVLIRTYFGKRKSEVWKYFGHLTVGNKTHKNLLYCCKCYEQGTKKSYASDNATSTLQYL